LIQKPPHQKCGGFFVVAIPSDGFPLTIQKFLTMRSHFRLIGSVYLFLVLAGLQQISVQAAPIGTSHVDDQVEVLATNRAKIEKKLIKFEEETGHKVVLMTRRSLGKAGSMKVLANQQFRDLRLGASDVLFLFVHNENKIRVDGGSAVSDITTDPQILKSIYDAVVKKSDFEDDELGLERGIDAVMQNLDPGLWASIVHPRTVPWALFSLGLSAALICAVYLGIKKLRQPY
jgi:uncharacterized membrane protein YgcG